MRILHKPTTKVPVMNSDFWQDNNFIINMATAQKSGRRTYPVIANPKTNYEKFVAR